MVLWENTNYLQVHSDIASTHMSGAQESRITVMSSSSMQQCENSSFVQVVTQLGSIFMCNLMRTMSFHCSDQPSATTPVYFPAAPNPHRQLGDRVPLHISLIQPTVPAQDMQKSSGWSGRRRGAFRATARS